MVKKVVTISVCILVMMVYEKFTMISKLTGEMLNNYPILSK
jgi:hypothetical protein